MTDMTSWLASLDEARLEHVLSQRPDSTAASIPRTLDELAQRLSHAHSVTAVLDVAPAPLRQVAEALLVLGPPRTEAALRDLLERGEPDHDAAVASTLERLYDCALAWPGADGSIGVAAGLAQVFPRPLRLGPPLHSVVEQMTGSGLRRALLLLGDPQPPAHRREAAAALWRRLSDPAAVRAIVATAPAPIAGELHAIAGAVIPGDPTSLDVGEGGDPGFDGFDGLEDFVENAFDAADFDSHHVHPSQYALRYEAQDWAIERGLMGGNAFAAQTAMAAEIAMALRGTTYRAPFTPYPPPIPSAAVDLAAVESSAAAAATDFAGQAVAVLDLIARAPLAQLKSGGVGARELARVAKTAGIDEAAARLAIEVAAELGLLAMDRLMTGGFLRTTEAYASWRELEPAAAYMMLLEAWLVLPFTPTATTDFEGRTMRLLHRHGTDDGAVVTRDVLLTVLASLPPGRGTTRAGLAPALLWSRPRRRDVPQDAQTPYATVWAEADRLGVIAVGALSRIGRAIDDHDDHALAQALRAMLPTSTDTARFGSDLTVLVAGSPSARVSSVLDAAADRESRGAGVTWRFSPASVRRALDDGADPGGLLTALEAIAVGELPQPLRYLISDVARRHGELQVSPARTVIRGADAALLAQVAADRTLRGLGLRLMAPTVLTSEKSAADTLLALRAAGYLPVPEPVAQPESPVRRAPSDAPAPRAVSPLSRTQPRPTRVSPRALAAHLLATGAADDTDPVRTGAGPRADAVAPTTEQVLGQLNPGLTADEVHQLAHAVETGGPVAITYESTSGARTQRVIGDAQLGGGMLAAWCYLRDDERYFLVDRILSVAPGSP